MSEKDKATGKPWKAIDDGIYDCNGLRIAVIDGEDSTAEEDAGRAVLVVQAVNHFEEPGARPHFTPAKIQCVQCKEAGS